MNSNNSIVIKGVSSTAFISITLPNTVSIGSYSLPRANFQATYSDINGAEQAQLGNIIVIGNDDISRIVKGTFSFETENHLVTLGQFNVTY